MTEATARKSYSLLVDALGSVGRPVSSTELRPQEITADNVGTITKPPIWFKLNQQLVDGDHWMQGAGWAGPMPPPTDPNWHAIFLQIRRAFCSQNIIREVVGRHAAGVAGRPGQWSAMHAVPLAALEDGADDDRTNAHETERRNRAEQIDRIEAPLRTWWNERDMDDVLRQVVEAGAWGERVCIRIFVPTGKMVQSQEDGGTVTRLPTGSMADMLDVIHVEIVLLDQANVVTSRWAMEPVGVYTYTATDGAVSGEVTYRDGNETVLRPLGAEDGLRVELGGNLFIQSAVFRPLICQSVREQQRLVNKALTMMSVNMDTAGFLERILLNAQQATVEYKDNDGNTKTRLKPHVISPFSINYIQGTLDQDDKGGASRATPQVVFREPSSPDTFVAAKNEGRRGILSECNQMHVEIAGDAVASGESRRQAMADFMLTLLDAAQDLAPLARGILNTVYRLASQFATDAVDIAPDDLRWSYWSQINAGPVPKAEADLVLKMVSERLLSRATAMGRLGVDDPEAELSRILEQPIVERWQDLFEVLGTTALASPALMAAAVESLSDALGLGLKDQVILAIAEELRRDNDREEQADDADDGDGDLMREG